MSGEFLRSRLGPYPIVIAGLAILAAGCFASVFGYLSIMRYLTFNASINDLGLWNQIFWSTIHGGPSAWNAHSRANFYFLDPYQDTTFIVLVPFYAASPTPTTLLILQSVLLGGAAVPLYFLARAYNLGAGVSLGVVGVYLCNFQLEGQALNDFHMQSSFPFFFLFAAYLLRTSHPTAYVAAAVLAGLSTPLDLLTVLAFAAAPAVERGFRTPGTYARLGPVMSRLRAEPHQLAVIGILLTALSVFILTGAITAYHVGESSSGGIGLGGSWWGSTPTRELFFIMTVAPFLGLFLLVPRSLITSVPLLAFLVVGSTSYFAVYGAVDVASYVAVFVWGLVLWLSHARDVKSPKFAGSGEQSTLAAAAIRYSTSKVRRRLPQVATLTALVVTLLLGAAYSPLSPLNDHEVTLQGYDQNERQITTITAADRFLNQALTLIPSDASVLTQNNIVQLTGRPNFDYAFPGKNTINFSDYEYILGDDDLQNPNAQFWFAALVPYIEAAYQSGSYGTLATGVGVILLEKGYTGTPLLEAPQFLGADQFALFSGEHNGSIAVHFGPTAFAFWYGPYISLPPGSYAAVFELRSNQTSPSYEGAIQLNAYRWPPSAPSPTVFNSTEVLLANFTGDNVWTNFTLHFYLSNFTTLVELPGLSPAANVTLGFLGCELTRIGN